MPFPAAQPLLRTRTYPPPLRFRCPAMPSRTDDWHHDCGARRHRGHGAWPGRRWTGLCCCHCQSPGLCRPGRRGAPRRSGGGPRCAMLCALCWHAHAPWYHSGAVPAELLLPSPYRCSFVHPLPRCPSCSAPRSCTSRAPLTTWRAGAQCQGGSRGPGPGAGAGAGRRACCAAPCAQCHGRAQPRPEGRSLAPGPPIGASLPHVAHPAAALLCRPIAARLSSTPSAAAVPQAGTGRRWVGGQGDPGCLLLRPRGAPAPRKPLQPWLPRGSGARCPPPTLACPAALPPRTSPAPCFAAAQGLPAADQDKLKLANEKAFDPTPGVAQFAITRVSCRGCHPAAWLPRRPQHGARHRACAGSARALLHAWPAWLWCLGRCLVRLNSSWPPPCWPAV